MFTEAKDDGSGGDNWSYKSCKAPVKSSPPRNQQPVFTGLIPFLSPNQQCQSTEGKISHLWTRLPHAYLGVFQLQSLVSLTTYSSWLHCGRVAMPLISPLMPIPQIITSCAGCRHNMPPSCLLDLLTFASESRVTWVTSMPILVFLGLSVLDLGSMYVSDRGQIASTLNMPPPRGGA